MRDGKLYMQNALMLCFWKSAASFNSVRTDKVVFTEKLNAVMVTQREAAEMQIPFCCSSRGRLNRDGKSVFSGCDFGLIMLAAEKPRSIFGLRIVTAFTYFIELSDISIFYKLQVIGGWFCLCPSFFWNLGMGNPDKKQKRASELSCYSDVIRPASSFDASGNVREKKHFEYL